MSPNSQVGIEPPESLPTEVRFTVPFVPPSVNHYKTPYQRRQRDGTTRQAYVVSAEAIAFKEAVAVFAQGQSLAPRSARDRRTIRYIVSVRIALGPNGRGDPDNFGKVPCDGLVDAGVIHSDARVRIFTVEVIDDERDNPRTEFHVSVWRKKAMTIEEETCRACGEHVTKKAGWMDFSNAKYCFRPACMEACNTGIRSKLLEVLAAVRGV